MTTVMISEEDALRVLWDERKDYAASLKDVADTMLRLAQRTKAVEAELAALRRRSPAPLVEFAPEDVLPPD